MQTQPQRKTQTDRPIGQACRQTDTQKDR